MDSEQRQAIECLLTTPTFSKSEVRRVGEALQGKRSLDESRYIEITDWYLDLLAAVYLVCWPEIEEVLGPRRAQELVTYSSRIKTEDTIVEKLARQRTGLDRVQDFAGGRFDIDCRLGELRTIASRIQSVLQSHGVSVKEKEYLEETQQGYRAIHLHITSPAAGRVELQLRTALQAAWANTYEVLADVAGRGIRYDSDFLTGDEVFDKLAHELRHASDSLYKFELALDQLPPELSHPLDETHGRIHQELSKTKKLLIESLDRLASDIVDRGRSTP